MYEFTLDNISGYVPHIKVQWSTDNGVTWHTTSNQSKDVSLWEIYDQNIKDLDPNIPIGSWVRMKMDVVWGDDVVADQIFKYVDTPGIVLALLSMLWGSLERIYGARLH